MKPLSLSEQLLFATLQVVTPMIQGSGFLVAFCEQPEDDERVIALVSNRHVLSHGDSVSLTFTRSAPGGGPDIGSLVSIDWSTKDVIYHPDPNIDVAALPLNGALKTLCNGGTPPFYSYIQLDLIPTLDEWTNFNAIEDVLMAGYPMGLFDAVHNFPIVRRGITASHPAFDFQGTPDFLIDMPCYNGCSGSPVFILEEGIVKDYRKKTLDLGGRRVYLMGILRAVPKKHLAGDVLFTPPDIPQTVFPSPFMNVHVPLFMNLGLVTKSTVLHDIDKELRIRCGR